MDDSHSRASELTLPPMAGPDLSVHQNNPRRSRQYSTEAWDTIKPLIKKFYIDDNKSLPQLMAMLSEEHDFHPTLKMFKRKFELWNFAKNITGKTARPLLDQKTVSDATGRLTILGPHGRPVDERRLRKYISRRKGRTPLNPMLSMQNLSTSGDSTSTTPTPQRELLDISDTSPDPHDMLPEGGSYEQDCPYRPWAKKFRFSETYPDGTIYQGDSFGYDSYINVDEERPCTSHCFCRKHHLQEAFTFEVHKSVNQMHITIYSHSLYNELVTHIPLDNVERGLGGPTRIVNGLALLRHYHTLMRRLVDLRSSLCDNPANQSLALEMSLLVNGFLGCGQVFQSFGYENLYELGFMDYQLWKYFQKQKFDKDITELDDGFCAIDDEEALSTSDSQSRSTTTFAEKAMADGAVKDLTEPLLDIDNEAQRPFSRPAGTDNPEVYTSTALHMTDGLDANRYSHPSAISGFGQPSRASHQSNKNVLASPCPPISVKSRILLNKWLCLAVREGNEGMVQTLLNGGANVNKADWSGNLPLSLAAAAGHEEVVRLLLDRGANVNSTYSLEDPPLSLAVSAGHEGIVRILLDRGANVNDTYLLGDSPLPLAVSAGYKGIVRILLNHGAYINGAGCSGNLPLSLAAAAGHEEVVRLLLDRGANVNKTYPWEDPPLSLAVRAGYKGIVSLLLDRGAYINGADCSGNPPLSLAAGAGHEEVVQLLVDRGADVNKAHINALCSALRVAAKQRNVNSVRRLIRGEADVQVALLFLQEEGGNHIKWLLEVSGTSSGATNVGRKRNWQSADSDASENIRHVRLKFVGQYMLMRKSAQSSQTRLRDLPQQFRNYRDAWSAGIETMRGLSRGETPPGVYETLAFLSLGKAIAETLRDRKNCDYLENFEQDLGRWGQLFKDAADLEAYEDALNLMWGVVYNEHSSRERGGMDEDTLIRFQELASTLVGHANDLLGSEALHDRRSDHYQQGRHKIDQIPVEDVPHRFSDHRSPGAESPSQLEAAPLQYPDPSNILDSMKTDTSPFEPVVLLLVAGAIFAVVIMFLEALRQSSNRFALHQIGTLQERYWVLAAYLGLGDTGTQASFQIRQEEGLHAGYSFSVY